MSTATLLFSVAWIRGHRREVRADASRPREQVRHAAVGTGPSGSPFAGWAFPDGTGAPALLRPARVGLLVTGVLLAAIIGPQARAQAAPEPATPDIDVPKRQETEPSVRIGGSPPAPCVEVDIAGHRAGYLDCATRALTEAAQDARRQAETAHDVSVARAGSPDVQVGVASRAGTRLRLRENFGVSVRPPAIPVPVSIPPTGPRR